MSVVLLLMRSRLRSSRRAAVLLVVLLALGGAVALSVAAGARRTASANDAILRSTKAADVNFAYGPEDPREIESTVRAVDGVADVSPWVGFNALPPRGGVGFITVLGFWQERLTVSRPVVTSGRMATKANEAMVNEAGGKEFGLKVGDYVDISLADAEGSFADAATTPVEIVGVGVMTDEVIEDELGVKSLVFVPRAFTERFVGRAVWGKTRVALAPGTDRGPVVTALGSKGLFVDELQGEDRRRVQDALRPLLLTMAGLAALAATATILVASQALTRLLRRRRADDRSLAAMGCSTRQMVAADLLCGAMIALLGAVLAATAAVAASPLFPVGPVRRIGVVRGVHVDLVVLAGGGTALALAVVALVGLGSWRRRTSMPPVSPGRAPALLTGRPAPATGLRLCTAQNGAGMTLAAVATGLAVVVATITFTGSLGRLIGDPALAGLSWDVGGRAQFDTVDLQRLHELVDNDATIERVTALEYASGEVNGTAVPVAVLDQVKGSPWPPLAAGRAPTAKDEALVGQATLRELGRRIGDTITIVVGTGNERVAAPVSRTYRIVGSAVAPAIGIAGTDTPKLATGVVISAAAFDVPASNMSPDIVLFDLTKGAHPDALKARFPGGLPVRSGTPTEWFTSATPAEVSQADGARTTIWLGVAALAVAIVGTVVHTLLGSVRQRRREYAVLKALGFTRGQVRTTVLCQSGALLVLAFLVAIPVGVGAGRWLWTGFANSLGVVDEPAVPVLLLVGSVVATAALVQGAALLPASLARRLPLGQTLRSE